MSAAVFSQLFPNPQNATEEQKAKARAFGDSIKEAAKNRQSTETIRKKLEELNAKADEIDFADLDKDGKLDLMERVQGMLDAYSAQLKAEKGVKEEEGVDFAEEEEAGQEVESAATGMRERIFPNPRGGEDVDEEEPLEDVDALENARRIFRGTKKGHEGDDENPEDEEEDEEEEQNDEAGQDDGEEQEEDGP